MSDAFGFLLAGFGVVMITLFSLAVVCAGIGALFKKFPVLAAAGTPKAEERSAKNVVPQGVSENVVAVIGAAVDQALGGRYRVSSIKRLDKKD